MNTTIVIGGASGMGEATVRRLSSRGGRLCIADVDLEGATRLAGELGGGVEAYSCDITARSDVEALAEASGKFATLVVTAGLSASMAPPRRGYDVNLVGPALALDVFEANAGPGSVALIVASMAGQMVGDQPTIDAVLDEPLAPDLGGRLVAAGVDVDDPELAYMYAKRGVQRLVRRRALAWGRRGARVISVSPGIVDTPMARRETGMREEIARRVAATPLGRIIDPDEVAAAIEFLTSPAASAITGTDVLIDGGAIARMQTS